MNGKWDHSTKPSTYKLLDKDGEIIYSGSFKDCMEQNKMNEEINSDVYFTRGYQKGFSDAQESLARKMDKLLLDYRDSGYERGYSHATKDFTNKVSKTIMDDRDAGYDQGMKDCYKILKEQLDEMIADQKEILKEWDYLSEARILDKLLDVRKKLFGSYKHES